MSQFVSWRDYQNFARFVKAQYRYIRTLEVEKFLDAVRLTAKERILDIQAGWEFWRAQRGHCIGTAEKEGNTILSPYPYSPERMKPQADKAPEGRVNPKGIPCLYGARDPETAIAEVRPWKGELVSVAKLSICRSVKLIECLKFHDENKFSVLFETPVHATPSSTDPDEIVYIQETPSSDAIAKNVWTYIDQAFSEPVTHSDDRADYAPTQILAEVIREEGYDGILYRSKLSDSDRGVNVVFLIRGVATVKSRILYEVTDVKVVSKIYEYP
jgi:RES domain